MVPEKLHCESYYLPPDKLFITCEEFGCSDGMDGKCWNCKEMTLYQWFMCQDNVHLKVLLNRGYSQKTQNNLLLNKNKNYFLINAI